MSALRALPIRVDRAPARTAATAERAAARWLLTGLALLFLGLFLFVPLAAVLVHAFEKGVAPYLGTLRDPDTLAAVRLTLLTAAVVVPLQVIFGLGAAWAIAKFEFVGKAVLVALIDLPLAVSPVVSGLLFVVLLGPRGALGPWLAAHNIRIIFGVPGIVLATLFVTFPFVARELIPLMQTQGTEEEQAARVLGAGGWHTFLRVTLPNVRWGLLAGVVVCAARAMGEFGAVSVVSGHIRGLTNTLPLHIEILYNEYNFVGAFAVSSILTALALATLGVKSVVDWKTRLESWQDPVEEEPW